MQNTEFTTGQIHPIECVRESWALIKDEYWILFAISVVASLLRWTTAVRTSPDRAKRAR